MLRSIFIVLLLIASAAVLARLTSTRTPAATIRQEQQPAEDTPSTHRLPYRLTLSAETLEVKLSAGDQPPVSELSGILQVAPQTPLFLTVRWKTPASAGEHRFAKLVLEPAGKPTIIHVFDAEGDIDDVFELP